jgi:hypothetical protein
MKAKDFDMDDKPISENFDKTDIIIENDIEMKFTV